MELEPKLSHAVEYFWSTRERQASEQGEESGKKDAGARAAVTGGAQMDGFVRLVRDILYESGLKQGEIMHESRLEIPGWYRAEKKWDLLVISDGKLIAAIEFKSQIGPSFGNNFNNRAEEAIGNATDLWAAYREGAFKPSQRPWLGYFMLLEECPASTKLIRTWEPYFRVFPEFQHASYVQKYQLLLTKLMRERLYDAACFILSNRDGGRAGAYREPDPELSFHSFLQSLVGRILALSKMHSM
jgi:hypothetical protein